MVEKINRFNDMLTDEQANAADCFVEVPGARHKVVGTPFIMSKADSNPMKGAPQYGADTVNVMKHLLGKTDEEVKKLKEKKIL